MDSAYEIAVKTELGLRGIHVRCQEPLELEYKSVALGKAYCMDLLVEECIIIEIKSLENMHPVYTAQLINYLKLMQLKLGYLINFKETLFKNGS